LDGGDHTYRLHTSILYTNCQTYHEAWQTFDREHLFVLVAFPQDPWMLTALEQYGLPTIAQGERARQFPNIAMTLTFGVAGNDDWWPGGMRDRNVVIAIQDLSALCTSLLGYKCQLVDPDDILTLYIRIAPRISPSLLPAVDDRPNPQSKLRRLLEPLRQLHSTEIIKIEGPSSLSYMQEIVEGTSGPPDNINEVLKKVLLALSGGDEARDHSDLSLAVVRYKSGLQTIHSHFGDYEDPWEMRPTYRYVVLFLSTLRS